MADFYFFTDLDKLQPQTPTQAFGAFEDSTNYPNQDCYRVTSKFNLNDSAYAYAVTTGKILVQQNHLNDTLYNIILKPNDNGIDNPPVKYFIYRGITQDSLFNLKIELNFVIENPCDLISQLSKEMKDKTFNNNVLGQNLIKIENYDSLPEEEKLKLINYSDDLSIDFIFDNVQLQDVTSGMSIGEFGIDNEIGFEIILSDVRNQPTLEIARMSENIIKVDSLLATETDYESIFNHWNKKRTNIELY